MTTLKSGKEIDKSAPLITKKSKEPQLKKRRMKLSHLGLMTLNNAQSLHHFYKP